MTVTAERPQTTATTGCERCGAPLALDQEWCLECGQAQTVIHRAPDWRAGAALVLAVVALVAAGTAYALVKASDNASRSAAAAQLPAASARTTAASTPSSTPAPAQVTGGPLLTWPAGLGGWTVVLDSSTSRASAQTAASGVAGKAPNLGLLNSSEHPSMTPGLWIVFSGRYPNSADAEAAAANLQAQGDSGARARMVEPPGGN
jgi:hypothetical protein